MLWPCAASDSPLLLLPRPGDVSVAPLSVCVISAALRAKLEEDRRERRRKQGLPEELTEEEKAREAEKARKKAEEEEAKRHVYVKPISGACVGVRGG